MNDYVHYMAFLSSSTSGDNSSTYSALVSLLEEDEKKLHVRVRDLLHRIHVGIGRLQVGESLMRKKRLIK